MKNGLPLLISYFENKKFRSIFLRYFKFLMLFILPVMLLFIIISLILYSGSRKAEAENLLMHNFNRSSEILDMINENINGDYVTIKSSANVLNVATASPKTVEKEMSHLASWPEPALREMRFTVARNKMYKGVCFWSAENNMVISPFGLFPLEEYYDTEWLSANLRQDFVAETRYDPFSYEQIVSIAHDVYHENVYIGTLLINLDYDYIARRIRDEHNHVTGTDAIVAPNNIIIYSSVESEVGKSVEQSLFAGEYSSDLANGTLRTDIDKDTIYMAYTTYDGYSLLSIIDSSAYAGVQGSLYPLLIIGIAVALLLSLLLAVFISLRLYSYLLDIIESFHFSTASPVNKTETGIIRSGLFHFIDHQNSIESEFAANLASLRKAQIMALQMQITPHFLLNTLQIINLSIMKQLHRDNETTHLIVLLSDLLRNALSTKEYLTDFSSEINMTKKYLQIESIRKQNLFSTEWIVDPRVERMSAVRCTLQPLLENCIQHALTPSENRPLTITIHITLEENTIVVSIEDNGHGISPQKLAEIHEKLALDNMPETIHIGLCNVSMRIRLIFGVSDCLHISSEEGTGTRVTLRFPAVTHFSQTNSSLSGEKSV
ncbi:MAG: hypothetical protein E7487_06210 [Ruminococcaceae bacterium]|nr:hypothetical protein [Oscillospiraceae bacterium]